MKKRNDIMRNMQSGAEDHERRTAVYVMTHKAFTPPPDPLYVPLHVGRAAALSHSRDEESSPLSFCVGDDTGDNISKQNCYYSELTGMYWVWKNSGADVVGTCHYRRYLLNAQGGLFTEEQILSLLQQYDVITTKELQLNFSYYEGFASHHKISYLDETARVIEELHPDYVADFDRLVRQKHTYFGNMLIAKKETYDAYMKWLFSILFEVERRVTVEEEDSYHRRIFGFISEFLQYVWVKHNGLKVYSCMVGMLGEKAEIAEVRQTLAGYFDRADVDGAKDYFLQAKKERPDLLMEASDITGELHLCMEVIAIAGLEQQAYGTNLLHRERGFEALMHYCNCLNRYVLQKKHGNLDKDLKQWKDAHVVTEVAENAANVVMQASDAPASMLQRIRKNITK